MNEKLRRALDATNDVHRPMPIEERDTAEYRLAAKKVLRSRLIDDMESLDTWRPVTYAVSALCPQTTTRTHRTAPASFPG